MTNITFPLSGENVAQVVAERDAEIERLRAALRSIVDEADEMSLDYAFTVRLGGIASAALDQPESDVPPELGPIFDGETWHS